MSAEQKNVQDKSDTPVSPKFVSGTSDFPKTTTTLTLGKKHHKPTGKWAEFQLKRLQKSVINNLFTDEGRE